MRFFRLKDFASAAFHFRVAWLASPNASDQSLKLLFNLCVTWIYQGSVARALERLASLHEKVPTLDEQVLQAAGFCFLKLGRNDEFISIYKSHPGVMERAGMGAIAKHLLLK